MRETGIGPRLRAATLIAYFDTSALIKLIFTEQESDLAEELWDRAELVASSQLIYPEARAAAAMAHRTGRIDARTLRNAVQAIDDLCAEIRVIGIDYTLAHLAGELAERHGLRGYDAVHLASVISIDDPGLLTATWDGELAAATFACGYAVAPA
ncbi:MAG TPA: type II toxin-antitoxin system VapC family toxin [Candidatus Acidoferrum sp.]|nr:type II toxin-antitoxin system VapC family toxin [Candidatus Acidoferrum sp.]